MFYGKLQQHFFFTVIHSGYDTCAIDFLDCHIMFKESALGVTSFRKSQCLVWWDLSVRTLALSVPIALGTEMEKDKKKIYPSQVPAKIILPKYE